MRDDLSNDFGPFEGRIWLNCAHQGPLPRIAAEEARQAVDWKSAPYELTQERFDGLPARLRSALAQLVGSSVDEIILGNSASYGLHLIANGYPWQPGDEALVVSGDFPSNILPWLGLEKKGAVVRQLRPSQPLPNPDELRAAITPNTKLFCVTWVHSFSGYTADLNGLGEICRQHGVTFVVNGSQAVGARPINVSQTAIDALVSVGFKWLCGPYGTGFCWVSPKLLAKLQPTKTYWLAQMTAADLSGEGGELQAPEGAATARQFDIFGTANFFNYKAWAAAVEYLLGIGIEQIARHDQGLVDRFIAGIDPAKYRILSPTSGAARSTLIFITHQESNKNEGIYMKLKDAGIDASFRRGKIRIAPHLYNTPAQIDQATKLLNSV